MRIIEVETLRPEFQPNLCVLRLRTDDGFEGLGESYYSAEAIEAYIHTSIAPAILSMSDPSPEAAAMLLAPYTGYQGGGIEVRAVGALDIALWDLFGHQVGKPLARVLGGPVREEIKTYNTCAGPGYVNTSSRQHSSNWGMEAEGPFQDLKAFLTRPGELAAELRDEGYTGMKVWPFDQFAEKSHGNEITPGELDTGLRVLEEIRSAASPDQMALMVELHGLWNRPSATRIIKALSDLDPYWVEDPMRTDARDGLARLRDDVDVPIALGETAVGIRGFLPLLESGIAQYVTVDAQWTGGVTSARRVAALADAYATPVAPHDCTGPVTFAAVCHLSFSQPNAVLQESVRAFLRTWYPDVVNGLPSVDHGVVRISDAPGLGLTLGARMQGKQVIRRSTSAYD